MAFSYYIVAGEKDVRGHLYRSQFKTNGSTDSGKFRHKPFANL